MSLKDELWELGEAILTAVILYLIIQASLMVTLGVEKPLYVVISGSMHPTYMEGDILVVKRVNVDTLEVGDIIVFDSPFGGIPIVHRIYEIRSEGGSRFFVTKGDGNATVDGYFQQQYPGIPGEHIIGTPIFKIPKLGYFQMWLNKFIDVMRCPPLPV